MRHQIAFLASLLVLTACASNAPSDPTKAALEVGHVELQSGASGSALQVAQDLTSARPNDPKRLVLLGQANAAMGRRPLAEAAFSRALALDDTNIDAGLGLAKLHLETDPRRALEELKTLERSAPRDARVLTDLGVAEDLIGDPMEAQSHYRAALDLDPSLLSTQVDLGLSLALSGRPNDALAILAPLAATPDASPRVKEDFAFAAAKAGQSSVASSVLGNELPSAEAKAALASYQAFANAQP